MSAEAISSPMITRTVAHLTSRSSRSLRSLGRPALRTVLRMASPLLRKRRYVLAAA